MLDHRGDASDRDERSLARHPPHQESRWAGLARMLSMLIELIEQHARELRTFASFLVFEIDVHVA